MAQVVQSSSQEYWRPLKPEVMRFVESASLGAACWRCGTEYPADARFCHVCGSEREPRSAAPAAPRSKFSASRLDLISFCRRQGLSVPSLVFFLLGITCMIAAALTGFVYKAETLVDWQAVQIWRMEWLLGAAAAFLAGILLKKKDK